MAIRPRYLVTLIRVIALLIIHLQQAAGMVGGVWSLVNLVYGKAMGKYLINNLCT